MTEKIEPILYIDPQQVPHRLCPVCGGAVYPPGWHCIRCGRDKPWNS